MEIAKLILRETKKKKIIAELKFNDLKTMPFPQLAVTDMSLNEKEVEVVRKEGRIVQVKAEGNVVFSSQAPSQTNIPASWQHEHLTHVPNPAYAPYNFIPLSQKVVEINPSIPPNNKYHTDRNTGWIDLGIEAITPLYIRGTLTSKEVEDQKDIKDKVEFFAPAGKIRIPGSSLRGMVRTMLEIISYGKFMFFEDRRLYYRGLADRSNLREEYQRKMSSYDSQRKRSAYKFSAGILRKSEKRKKGLHFEIVSSGSNFKQIPKIQAKKRVLGLGQKDYPRFKFYKLKEGFLVVSGDMPNKKREWLINYPSDNAEVIPIPDEDALNYNNDRTRHKDVPNLLDIARNKKEVPCFYVRWEDEKGNDRVSFGHTGMFRLSYEKTIGEHINSLNHRLNDQVLNKLKKEISQKSYNAIEKFKDSEFASWELESTLEREKIEKKEIIKILQISEKIDFAEAIFGNENTHAGRVFFEDAFLAQTQDGLHMETVTPKILASPKPTTFQNYLVQGSDEVKQLNHYNSNASVRGYKMYWHKSCEQKQWVETDHAKINENPNQYTAVKPVNREAKFSGRIRFENLSDNELGALLFALDLPEGCAHKLGMGKPLGLGSIRISSKLYLSNRNKRYKNFFSEWDNKIEQTANTDIERMKRKFEQYVLEKVGEDVKKSLWETDRLREFLVILGVDFGRELEEKGQIRYMTIGPTNEFKNRYILPRPTALMPASNVNKIMAKLKGEATVESQKPIYIKEVKIKGLWDSFDINWQIDPEVSILVGINGSGKTTILELMRQALENNYEKKVHYAPQEFTLIFDNGERINYKGKKQDKRRPSGLRMEFISTFDIAIEYDDEKNRKKLSDFFKRQLTLELVERIERLNIELTSLPKEINITPYIDEFIDIVNDAFERPGKTIQFVGGFRFDDSVLFQLRNEGSISEETCKKMESIIRNKPYYPDLEFVWDLEGKIGKDDAARYRSLILRYVQFNNDNSTSHVIFRLDDDRILMLDQLSAGEKQFLNILLATLILTFKSLSGDLKYSVIIMDEPELSLHMRWQKTLIDYIRRINENVQIIIATHSPDILKKGWMDRAIGVDEIRSEWRG